MKTYIRTPEMNEKMRQKLLSLYANGYKHPRLGVHLSDETKKKISDKAKGRIVSQETRAKMGLIHKGNKNMVGKHCSEESKIKNREAHLGVPKSKETKLKHRNNWDNPIYKEKHLALLKEGMAKPENKEKHKLALKKYCNNSEFKNRMSKLTKKRWQDLEYRTKMTNMVKLMWSNSDFKNSTVKAQRANIHIRPNNKELILCSLFNKHFPDYKYTGDFSVIIGGKSPDWTNVNGKKSVILLHGLYWHLWKPQKDNPNLTKQQVEQCEIEHYKRFGFHVLIIWEDELKDLNEVKNKVVAFNNTL
ncbi:NUMOD3 domain-containing DNA-binding protein [Candidatus Dojkabacteria bacterium]|jgi:G:T-mismatch repair DNA endonuclease (very short patch repair protein)|nr:NUMOD3 domain-containing DNA-binding protein [Candidatus Dojkabacteria bacterium]